MEPISLRKLLANIYHSKSPPHSSDCVFSAAPSASLGSAIPEAALATSACGLQVEHLQTSTLDDSKASTRVGSIAKKGKGKSAEGQSEFGLRLIHQLPQAEFDIISPEKQCPIDIVAVHGIRGGAYRTWTHTNGHFWLRDSLPEEVPGARIFSYGYPANVFLSHETGRIGDHATSLLEDLRHVRRNPEEQKRPIVFICHSMGGLIVKKAINITVVDDKRFSNIRKSTAAIFFLATPHCGSDPAKILSVCADILNLSLTGFSRFTGKVRSDMIKPLSPGSTTLLDISNDFREHPQNMRIFQFIEQKSTPPISGRIVDDTSGRMFVAGEVTVPMQGCNHQEVACFESKNSNGYRKIVNTLNEVTSEITNSQ